MKNKNKIEFIIILGLTIIICFPYMTMHYSTDTYTILGDGYKNYAINTFLNAGRPFSSLITYVAGCFEVPINIFIQVLFYMGIIISCMCVIEIKKHIEKTKNSKNILEEVIIICISYIIIFNFMYLENLYFAEIPIMAIGIWLYIKAGNSLVEEKSLKSIIFLLLGELCYQGTINFFITYTFVLLIIKHKKINKAVITKMIVAFIFCVIVIGINLVQIKICGNIWNMTQNRLGGIKQIPQNITYIMKNIDMILIRSSALFPKYLFLAFIGSIYITIIFYSIKSKDINPLMMVLCITLVAIVSSVAINIISISSFGLGRMVFSVGALIGLIFMYLYSSTDMLEGLKLIQIMLLIILGLYTIANAINTNNLLYKHKKANELDKKECDIVESYIKEYEEKNNITIKKIAVIYDKNVTWNYTELNTDSLFTHRALMIWWCNVEAINYYENRNLQKINIVPREIYYQYFEGKNWNELDREQFVFVDDTLYYGVY